ncbi:class D beta-lactamase [Sphingomonas hengshuiensis]|uniref:class D beta-lactamase n=1 Tax=Sphingomonas hengshuiensis TaxID=1609977 RepID=UPI0009816473|nr:class D beta-lactamase [Sphingomonas hengshuiensis]
MDRRTFAGTMLLGAGMAATGFPGIGEGMAHPPRLPVRLRATLVVELSSGRALHRSGAAATRFSPCSTFKIPLGLMGFDSGILRGPHDPAWDYDPRVHQASRDIDKQATDPTSWLANSVVWYSQVLTRQLGAAKFQRYIDRFGYGNRDLTGTPGKGDGLTQAWLMNSLTISPDEQVAFLRRMLAHKLVSPRAHALTEQIMPVFEGAGGWTVHGKTGSGRLLHGLNPASTTTTMGWFVGWADKGARRVVFARFGAGEGMPADGAGGPAMRKAMLAEIGALAG